MIRSMVIVTGIGVVTFHVTQVFDILLEDAQIVYVVKSLNVMSNLLVRI